MSENNSQTQEQIAALRTLQQSYDALADASASGAKQGPDPSVNITDMDAKLGDVEDALEYIEGGGLPTITAIAKQGTNASATLTTTQAAVVDGNDTAISVAKEIRSEVGTGSDTAAETGTLFAVLKWVKDKVKSIFNLIGSPASGQPSTLFAAIAAGGGGGAEFYHNPATEMSSATATLDPNIMYVWDEVSALTITLNAPTDTSIVNEYMLCFYSGSTPTTLTFTNNNVQVVGNIAAESIINVSIVYNSLTDSYSVLIA